jgi:hypothetical protein
VSASRGKGFTAQHRSGRLFGGLQGARSAAEADLKCVAVHGWAVGVLPLDKNKTDGGRRYRQAEYGFHSHPSGRPRIPETLPPRRDPGSPGARCCVRLCGPNVLCRTKLLQVKQCNLCRVWPFGSGRAHFSESGSAVLFYGCSASNAKANASALPSRRVRRMTSPQYIKSTAVHGDWSAERLLWRWGCRWRDCRRGPVVTGRNRNRS